MMHITYCHLINIDRQLFVIIFWHKTIRNRIWLSTFGLAHSPKSISFKLWSSSINKFSYSSERQALQKTLNINMQLQTNRHILGVSLVCHFTHAWNSYFYWFEIPMCISLAVDVGHRRHNLSEKHPGLLLWQTVLCYDVVKQLTTCTILRGEVFYTRSDLYKQISVCECMICIRSILIFSSIEISMTTN